MGLRRARIARATTADSSFDRAAYSLNTFRRAASRTQRTLQVPLRTSTARKLLVAFCLGLCTIAASDWCAAGRLGYYSLDWQTLLIVLVAAVYGVVALQEITRRMSAQVTTLRM